MDDAFDTTWDDELVSTPSSRHNKKLTQEDTFKKLKELDDQFIEMYLRNKKLKKLKKI